MHGCPAVLPLNTPSGSILCSKKGASNIHNGSPVAASNAHASPVAENLKITFFNSPSISTFANIVFHELSPSTISLGTC